MTDILKNVLHCGGGGLFFLKFIYLFNLFLGQHFFPSDLYVFLTYFFLIYIFYTFIFADDFCLGNSSHFLGPYTAIFKDKMSPQRSVGMISYEPLAGSFSIC